MEKVKFGFEVNEIKVEKEMHYTKKPSRTQIEEDMKEWFFANQYMWFYYEMDGKEINLGDD
ncbi:MAG: hypothetical protein IJ880_04670 [Bacilli bacterium]|nr:hypothetical protein [Bacilli bacterium]MBR3119717.1 hypothetical protein [Oceanobacillus sp.]